MLNDNQIRDNDRRFLIDFYSLGVAVHEYTAVALYHEAQRLLTDDAISTDDKPRIQMAIRAKIFAEAVASMETVGKLVYAIRNRKSTGIAYRYVQGSEAHSERGLRLFKKKGTNLLDQLQLPSMRNHGILGDLEAMSEAIHRIYTAYLDPDSAGCERKNIVAAYRAIKHGSLVVNDPRSISIWPCSATTGHVWMITRWPSNTEGLEQLELKEINNDQDAVSGDIDICKQATTLCSNLCQLLICLIDQNALTY